MNENGSKKSDDDDDDHHLFYETIDRWMDVKLWNFFFSLLRIEKSENNMLKSGILKHFCPSLSIVIYVYGTLFL